MSELIYTAIGLGLVGAVFCGVYAMDRERLWWAIIPGLAAFTLLAALVADALIGTDPANDWASVLVTSAGAAVIAAVLRRPDARRVLAIVAGFALAIGILMMPVDALVKVALLAIVALGAVVLGWGTRGHSTTLRPH